MSIISFFFVVVAEYNCNIFLSIALCFYTALYFFSVLYCNHVFLMAKAKQNSLKKARVSERSLDS